MLNEWLNERGDEKLLKSPGALGLTNCRVPNGWRGGTVNPLRAGGTLLDGLVNRGDREASGVRSMVPPKNW